MSIPPTFQQIFGAPNHPAPLEDAVLILIDIQREYIDGAVPLEGVHEAAAEARKLLDLARRNGVPVIHVNHAAPAGAPAFNPDGPHFAFHPDVEPLPGEKVVTKHFANAFQGTGLHEIIQATGRKELIIAGDTTHVCVSTTTRVANELYDYRVTVVADATATKALPDPLGGIIPAETVKAAALAELGDAFAVVVKNADAWASFQAQ